VGGYRFARERIGRRAGVPVESRLQPVPGRAPIEAETATGRPADRKSHLANRMLCCHRYELMAAAGGKTPPADRRFHAY